MNVACQSIEFGDQEHGAGESAMSQGTIQCRPESLFRTGLDLGYLLSKRETGGLAMRPNGFPLCFESETAASLLRGAHPVVGGRGAYQIRDRSIRGLHRFRQHTVEGFVMLLSGPTTAPLTVARGRDGRAL